MPAAYEVRLTPLLLGVPTFAETDAGGITTIDEADTTLVEQYDDVDIEVNIAISEPTTGKVTLSIDDPLVADLEPFAQALWIAYKRPAAVDAEALVYGPCNVITDYDNGTVTLVVQDPSERCQHHYIRRGDPIIDLTSETGQLRANGQSIDQIVEAARNTQEQQDRNVPALAFEVFEYGDGIPTAPFIEFERGQEVWDLVQQILRSTTGPDAYTAPKPAWAFPLEAYAEVGLYDPPTDPTSPASGELGRNLDPANPDSPQPGEVIFEYGQGLDNLVGFVESPEHASTHVHVVDADRKYRITRADAGSSADIGVWVDWIATDYKVVNGDTNALQALADAHIKAYGRPPKHMTCTLRPEDTQPYHYGHPLFAGDTTGDCALGDYIRVRATRGQRSTSLLARITAARFTSFDGLPLVELSLIPAVGGIADEDPQGN